MNGHIHSIESFGTVDGPGIRMVIFFQGCPMRCLYCHNPDTWNPESGRDVSAEDLLTEYEKSRSFYEHGGITATGGEPMMQLDFLTELFSLAAARGIHTCLDTSGITFLPDDPGYLKKLDLLLKHTNLVLLDIKHIDPDGHRALTGHDNKNILAFASYLDAKNIPVWIRHVVVPGITDSPTQLVKLGNFIGTLHNVKALDVLAYHDMGKSKYKKMGIPYPLSDTPVLSEAAAREAKKLILSGILKTRGDNSSCTKFKT